MRNAVVLGRAGLTFGYAGHTLAQRISFDRMDWHDYARSFPCFLPDGNGIGRLLAGAGACARFGWDERPDTFYAIGIWAPLLLTILRFCQGLGLGGEWSGAALLATEYAEEGKRGRAVDALDPGAGMGRVGPAEESVQRSALKIAA